MGADGDLIPADRVGLAITEITRALEEDGRVSALVKTDWNFESWWQREILLAFARHPYNRRIGRKDFDDSTTGAAIEMTWDATDGRMRFCRRYGQKTKRIDLVLRRGPTGAMFHLVELKVVGPRTQNIATLERDFHGLSTMEWDNVCSAWLVALVHGFDHRSQVLERLRLTRAGNVRVYQVASMNPKCKLFVATHRVF